MADARDEKVWTNHASEHLDIKDLHGVADDYSLRVKLLALGEKGTSKVMDLGCGSGLWRNLFNGFDYTGVDQNQAMINAAMDRLPDDTFVVSNGMSLPFDDGSFDLVFTAAVIQHNQTPDKEKVLAEIHRVLKPGGAYLCTENTFRLDNYKICFGDVPYVDSLFDGYSYTPAGWAKFMLENKFKRVWFQEPSEYLYVKE